MEEYVVTHYTIEKLSLNGKLLKNTLPSHYSEKEDNSRFFSSLSDAQEYYESIKCIYTKEKCTFKIILKFETKTSFEEIQSNEDDIVSFLLENQK